MTYNVIGCAMKTHNALGYGFTHFFKLIFNGIRECFAVQEVIPQRCLAIELEKAIIDFKREVEQTIYNEGIEVGTRRADFVVQSCLIIEIKAVINLEDVHLAQVKNYLVAYNFEKGLLINFGSTKLQY